MYCLVKLRKRTLVKKPDDDKGEEIVTLTYCWSRLHATPLQSDSHRAPWTPSRPFTP